MTVPFIEAEIYEGSTIGWLVSFVDETSAPATPDSAVWTLTDVEGNVVNNREDVPISSLGTSVTIVLSGDDLLIGAVGITGRKRELTVKAVYDSSLGNNLPWNQGFRFEITPLLAVNP